MNAEETYLKLISGRNRSPAAAVLRGLLTTLVPFVAGAVRVRNALYDRHWLAVRSAGVPVISIGNLTTGGTGKTPVVAHVCDVLMQHRHKPGILSRGYRATSTDGNDEFQVLARLCPHVPHVQEADRCQGAARLLAQHPDTTVLVLDDGFQHRRLARSLDIVLVDATNPFGYGYLFPRGLLREPLSSLRRAGLVLVTRCELVDDTALDSLGVELRRWTAAPILRLSFAATDRVDATGQSLSLAELRNGPSFLVSGIGNPTAFEATCRNAGLTVVGTRWFPDHHAFTDDELRDVQRQAQACGATRIVVTMKDLVKFSPHVVASSDSNRTLPIVALSIAARMGRDEDRELFATTLVQAAAR